MKSKFGERWRQGVVRKTKNRKGKTAVRRRIIGENSVMGGCLITANNKPETCNRDQGRTKVDRVIGTD